MKFNLKLFLLLLIINNVLHLISEKIIIVLFIVVFYYITCMLGDLIEKDYILKIESIKKEIDGYFSTILNTYKYYSIFFKRILFFSVDFHTFFKKSKRKYLKKFSKSTFANLWLESL